jgi:hypothetical protein
MQGQVDGHDVRRCVNVQVGRLQRRLGKTPSGGASPTVGLIERDPSRSAQRFGGGTRLPGIVAAKVSFAAAICALRLGAHGVEGRGLFVL